jgi:transposase
MVGDPERLDDDALARLDQRRATCPPAATAYPRLQAIGRSMRHRPPDQLDRWFLAAASSGLPALVTLAAGRRRERSALVAALTWPGSTGPGEGHLTRRKLLQRQGYGRAGLSTLPRRFVRAA